MSCGNNKIVSNNDCISNATIAFCDEMSMVRKAFIDFQGIPGTGTVTSVGLSMPSEFTVSNSPVTSAGVLTVNKATQPANYVYAGPVSGADAAPTFRALVPADFNTVLPVYTADNGLSRDADNFELGNEPGETNATLTGNREIPNGGFSLFTSGTTGKFGINRNANSLPQASLHFGNGSTSGTVGADAIILTPFINSTANVGVGAIVTGGLAGFEQTASGLRSVLLGGDSNVASGIKSVVMGGGGHVNSGTNAAIIAGGNNTVSADNAFAAAGSNSTITGGNSAVLASDSAVLSEQFTVSLAGFGLRAQSAYQVVMGQYNVAQGTSTSLSVVPTDNIFIIGNGTADLSRSNALSVRHDGIVQLTSNTTASTTNLQAGAIRWNATAGKHQGYNGTTWNDMY